MFYSLSFDQWHPTTAQVLNDVSSKTHHMLEKEIAREKEISGYGTVKRNSLPRKTIIVRM